MMRRTDLVTRGRAHATRPRAALAVAAALFTATAFSAAPAPAAAQESLISTGPHLGLDLSVPGTPATAGLHVTWHRPPVPWLAVRGRMDIGLTTTDLDEAAHDSLAFRAFTGELDAVLTPDHSGRGDAPTGAIDPRLFAGVGLRSARDTDDAGIISPVGSYGGGLSYWLSQLFRVDAEARYRGTLLGRARLAPEFDDGWSFSLAGTFHFGVRWQGDAPPEPVVASTPPDTVYITVADTAADAADASDEDDGAAGPGFRFDPKDGLHALIRETWPPPEDATVAETLQAAEGYLGVPYVWGGADPEPGFDCSGFVQHVYEEMGMALPRPSRRMAEAGEPLPPVVDSLRPGDLMFFSQDGDRITHVAIYVGDNQILHATGSGDGVSYDDLTTPRGNWFAERFVSGSRVVGVPLRATRAAPLPVTEEHWDPKSDGAPPPGGGP